MPGFNGFIHRGYFDNSPGGFNVREQSAAWYAVGSQLGDLDVTKGLLRIWVDCFGHLKFADERDRHTWWDEVDAIPRTHSAETIVVVHSLTKAWRTPRVSSSWQQTTEVDFPLAGADRKSKLRDDSGTVKVRLTIPQGNGNQRGNNDIIFEDMTFDMELQ